MPSANWSARIRRAFTDWIRRRQPEAPTQVLSLAPPPKRPLEAHCVAGSPAMSAEEDPNPPYSLRITWNLFGSLCCQLLTPLP